MRKGLTKPDIVFFLNGKRLSSNGNVLLVKHSLFILVDGVHSSESANQANGHLKSHNVHWPTK